MSIVSEVLDLHGKIFNVVSSRRGSAREATETAAGETVQDMYG